MVPRELDSADGLLAFESNGDIHTIEPDGTLLATATDFVDGDLIVLDRDGEVKATIQDASWPPGWQPVVQ